MRNRCTNQLSKAKVRQSWSKYNLYNLSRIRLPDTRRTFFQQKWDSKSISRAYHGEQVRESQWERMFSRRLRGVVSMDANYLARNDGSRESAGRGSGLEPRPGNDQKRQKKTTPYMQMTFAPLERRLDVAIFRSLFASSARQARQFVVHGAVTVNGKKMTYPGYLLNPGDMFQVNPERVMFATGAPKDKHERRAGRIRKRLSPEKEGEASAEKGEEAAAKEESGEAAESSKEAQDVEDPRETLKVLLGQAKSILSSSRDTLPAKRKQEIRGFQKAIRRVLSRSSSTVLTDSLDAQFAELKLVLTKDAEALTTQKKAEAANKPAPEVPDEQAEQAAEQAAEGSDPESTAHLNKVLQKAAENPDEPLDEDIVKQLSEFDVEVVKQALVQLRDNPIDSSKPYATPWRPRDYMSAFAFIPRYLEVNQNICAAVYLRHPIARPGLAEVPTPFNEVVGGNAFAWYLKSR
ncbi:mitochondrial 37S ribosomal protein nam9 [Arachnomyces sp. PD_36]|nr:mitochondrial 37S ribosomal protein nam9 [Arachnomyces sp. PD_36]